MNCYPFIEAEKAGRRNVARACALLKVSRAAFYQHLAGPSRRVPASRSACLTHSRTAVSVRSKSLATWPTDRSPRWHSSTISALKSAVNERRRRGFFLPMLSMVGHPSGGEPLMMDVRQSGPGSVPHACRTEPLVGEDSAEGTLAMDPRH